MKIILLQLPFCSGKNHIELRVLKYFLITAREENITKAAQLLHITQPTLSRRLMQPEDELGVRLFERSNHHIILTDEGMLLQRRAQEIVSLEEKTKNEFSAKKELSGEIEIGSGEFKSFAYFRYYGTRCLGNYPTIELENLKFIQLYTKPELGSVLVEKVRQVCLPHLFVLL